MGINKSILKLAVPSIIANITVPLVGMADVAIAGHLNSDAATLIGGITGGGGGQPTTYYLPNGWAITMSAHRMSLDVNKVHVERGVEPDIYVTITEEDKANKVDAILEKAIEVLSE